MKAKVSLLIGVLILVWATTANAQFFGCPTGFCNAGAGGGPPPSSGSLLLLANGTDQLLLANGADKLCLASGC